MFWQMRGYVDTRLKLVHQFINPSVNTRKIIKLCVDVCGHECGCPNLNVIVSASANDNVIGCVDVYEKIFLRLLTKPNGCVIMASQNKKCKTTWKIEFCF